MATVTGMHAERMLEIENASVVDGEVNAAGDLTLLTRDGTPIAAGNVKGPKGDQGPVGNISASPAGGALSGNYPNPTISDTLKDADPGIASMRTLGTGAKQAAPGTSVLDSGWVSIANTAGDLPFGPPSDLLLFRYRKIGRQVHLQIRKAVDRDLDRSTATGGNFPNVRLVADGTVPLAARPKDANVIGQARLADSPQGVVLTTAGTIVWVGGFPRLYRLGQSFEADFFFMTDN